MENHDNTTDTPSRPLGFWLRAADGLLAREFQAAFAAEGLGRREARLLTLLGGDTLPPELAERIRRHGGKKLRGLAERGWVAENDGAWTLTEQGRAAQARLDEATAGIRARISSAVSDEDLATTRASLEALAREFGGNTAERVPRGFGRRGFGPGPFGRGFGSGFGPHGFGPDRAGFGPDHGGRGHDLPGHGRGAAHAGHGACAAHVGHAPAHTAEHAYERGFDAGFARGREAGAA